MVRISFRRLHMHMLLLFAYRFASQFERFNRLEEAGALWGDLVAARPSSYAVWYGQADFETYVPDAFGSLPVLRL